MNRRRGQPPKKQINETALNLDFETPADARGVPAGWRGGGEGYELASDTEVAKTGRRSGRIRCVGETKPSSLGFGSLTQYIDAGKYRGQRVRFRGYVRTEEVVAGRAGLWMRIDGNDDQVLAFHNRYIHGTTGWKRQEVVLDVPAEATAMCFGMLLQGDGSAWVDDLKIEIVGRDVPITGKPMRVRVAIKIDPELLNEYVGKYRVRGTVFEFRKENDALFVYQEVVYQEGAHKVQLFPESETKFFYRVLDAQFSFVRERNGKVKRIILHQYDRKIPGNRIENGSQADLCDAWKDPDMSFPPAEQRGAVRFPELNLFESKESQKTAIRKWTKQLRGSWSWALYIGFGATLCVLLGAKIVWELQVMMPIWAAIMIGAGSCIISLGILVHFFARRSLVPHLRRELNAGGIPVCMKCGYDLRGSKERCPECGEEFETK